MWRSAAVRSAAAESSVGSVLYVRMTSRSTDEPSPVTPASSRSTIAGAATGSKRR